MTVSPVDARARKILFDTHWKGGRWIDRQHRPPMPTADFAYAKQHGLMFDPFTGTHDQLASKLKAAAEALELADVARAFLASLSTRRPDLRSGLSSWTLAKATKPHPFTPRSPGMKYMCAICSGHDSYQSTDLSVLSFERQKWGGVRHAQPIYQYLDLVALGPTLPATPTADDREIWERILDVITRMPADEKPTHLSKRLKDILPSDKNERDQLLEILAISGILAPKKERNGVGEWNHVGMWRAIDRYDAKLAGRLFPKGRAPRKPSR